MGAKFRLKSYHLGTLLGSILVVAGIVILLVMVVKPSSSANSSTKAISYIKSNQASQKTAPQTSIYGTPAKITIPSLGIDLNILPGYYDSARKSWMLSLNSALFATVTEPANNQAGLTFIYGHNNKSVFMNLRNITPFATAFITTDNNHRFLYTFRSSFVTSPADTSLFNYQGQPVLVVQTCSGSLFQDRQLFIFDFTKVES